MTIHDVYERIRLTVVLLGHPDGGIAETFRVLMVGCSFFMFLRRF